MKRIVAVAVACASLATFGLWRFAPGMLEGGDARMPAAWPLRALCHWDCWWYTSIADQGYWYEAGKQSPVAYFPAFPMAIRALHAVGFNEFLAGVLLSAGSGIAALVLLRRLAERLIPEHAWLAQALLLLYPWAIYLYGVVYSDSLFLLLVVGAFLALEKDRPWLATALGVAAVLCRPVAPAVVVGLTVRSLERRRRAKLPLRPIDWLPALAGLGLVGWMLFLQLRFDDALAFVHVHDAPGWDQPPGFRTWFKEVFWQTILERWRPWATLKLGSQGLVALGAFALSWPTAKRLGWGYGVYLAIVLGMPLVASKDFQGLGRYVMAGFPAFLTLATMLGPRPRAARAWLALSALALAALSIAFGADQYIA